MKKWIKYSLVGGGGTVGIAIVAGLVSLALYWDMIEVVSGTQEVRGATDAVPDAVPGSLPPITDGPTDWTRWRGPRDDGRSAQTGILKDWSGGLEKLWEVKFLCRGKKAATWSAPVVRGNRLVVPGRDDENDLLFCLDPVTGALVWKTAYPARKSSFLHGTGPRATPFVDGDRVYTFGRAGDLVCGKLLDGSEVWHRNVTDEGGDAPKWGHSSSPLVTETLVVVQGGGSVRVIAYDKMTGDVKWTSGEGEAGYAALTRVRMGGVDAALAFHGTGLAAVRLADGAELWDTRWKTMSLVNATTPVVEGDLVFITSDYGKGGSLLRFDAGSVTTVWANRAIAAHHSDPFVIDGHIYGYSGMSAQNRGDFKCLVLATGEEKWSTREMGHGTCVHVDGHLLCCDIEGNLFLMKPDPEKFMKVTGMPKALGDVRGPVWTVPVIANGLLYLRFKQKLVCYRLAPTRQ